MRKLKYIKYFESFRGKEEEILNQLLDKMSRGEVLNDYEKKKLDDLSTSKEVEHTEEDVKQWLEENYGTMSSEFFTKNQIKGDDAFVLSSPHNGGIMFIYRVNQRELEVYESLFRTINKIFNINYDEIEDIIKEWFGNKYNQNIKKLTLLFVNLP